MKAPSRLDTLLSDLVSERVEHHSFGLSLAPHRGMTLWEFAVFSYLMVSTGNPRQTLSFPTLAACEAARQAVLEIAQEERPNPVVGLCKLRERESLVGGRTPAAPLRQ